MLTTPAQRDLSQFSTKLAAYGETPRYWRINRLEAFYNGQQYEGRPNFWNNDFPLRERAPVVQVGFTRAAVNRLSTLVFGDRSFPRVAVDKRVRRATLTDAERDALQALVDDVLASLVVSHLMRQVIVEGLKCSSACIVVGLVNGLPCVELIPSKWCTPQLRRDGSVECVVVQYKHPREDDPKKWDWYRREITQTEDRVYACVPFEEGRVPEWSGVAFVSTPLEFCPVRWVRNLRPATAAASDIDGTALIEGIEDEVEALDLELSQLYRNALYNGDPQMVKIGADGQPQGDGRQAGPAPTLKDPGPFSWANSVIPQSMRGWSGVGSDTIKKSPVKVWNLPAGGDAKLVESTGAGADIIDRAIDQLRRVLCDVTGVVLVDPHTLGNGDLSARALSLMHAPMLDVADNLRVEYGAVLVGIVNDVLRLLTTQAAIAGGINLPSYDAASRVLSRLYGVDGAASRVWIGASLSLAWGAYFDPSASDRQTAVDTAMKANGGRPVLSQRAAVQSVAAMFGVRDVDAEIAAIDGEETATHASVSSTLAALDAPKVDDDAPEVTIEEPLSELAAPAADSALNGAQVASMVEIVEKVAGGSLPRDAAKAIVMRAFLVDDDGAEAILGSAGRDFVVTPKPEASPFGGR